jgi:hypothetical protein
MIAYFSAFFQRVAVLRSGRIADGGLPLLIRKIYISTEQETGCALAEGFRRSELEILGGCAQWRQHNGRLAVDLCIWMEPE